MRTPIHQSSWRALLPLLLLGCIESGAGPGPGPAAVVPPAPTEPGLESDVEKTTRNAAACAGNPRCLAAQNISDRRVLDALEIKKYDGGPLCRDPKQEPTCQRLARQKMAELFDNMCGDYKPNDRPPLPTGTVYAEDGVIHDRRTPFHINPGGTVGDLNGDMVDEYVNVWGPVTVKGGGFRHKDPYNGGVLGTWNDDTKLIAYNDGVRDGTLFKEHFGNTFRSSVIVKVGNSRKLVGILQDWSAVSFDITVEEGGRFRASNRRVLAADGTIGRVTPWDHPEMVLKPHDHAEVVMHEGNPVIVTIVGENMPSPNPSSPTSHGYLYFGTPDYAANKLTWRRVEVKPAAGRIGMIDSFTVEYKYFLDDGGVKTEPQAFINLIMGVDLIFPNYRHPMPRAVYDTAYSRCPFNTTECRVSTWSYDPMLIRVIARLGPGQTSMAVANHYNYRDPEDRSNGRNNNILYIHFRDNVALVWGSALDWSTGFSRLLPMGLRRDTTGRHNSFALPSQNRIDTQSPAFTGDFHGRRVLIEKLMNGGRHVVFPTASVPKIDALLIPPPHWFGLQDYASMSLDDTRSVANTNESVYTSSTANGTSWSVSGGVQAGTFAHASYSHDEEETRINSTTQSTSFTRTRSVTRSRSADLIPQVLVQFMCSDDFWYVVKRGTIPRLNNAGEPVREGGTIVRDRLAGGNQFLMVQVPRRSVAFFQAAATNRGVAAQPAQAGEISPIRREQMPLWRYNEYMTYLGQEWRRIDFKRVIGYPASYWEDREADGAAKKYFDINGRRITGTVVTLGSSPVPAIGTPTVSWSIDTATDQNAMRQVMSGTTNSTTDRVEAGVTIPLWGLLSPTLNASNGTTSSRTHESGNGVGTGLHESTRFGFSWNGWRLHALTQRYFDQRLPSGEVSPEEQWRALKEIGGFVYNERFPLRQGDEVVEVPFLQAPGDAQRTPEFRNAILERLNFNTTAYTYRHNKEVTWTIAAGVNQGQPRTGKVDFVVVDYLVKWHRSLPPPDEHFFPRRARAAFLVGEKFCDFLGNQVVEVMSLGDDGRPVFDVPRGGDCNQQFEGALTMICRENRATTDATCVSRRGGGGVVRPKSTRELTRGSKLRSAGGELDTVCTGGTLYAWNEAVGEYTEVQMCDYGCTADGASCDELEAYEPQPEEPEAPLVPGCETTREIACELEATCCAPAGHGWDSSANWDWWCQVLADGACGIEEEPSVPQVCGDGILDEETESCDDGNTTSGDDCPADCVLVAAAVTGTCGDGVPDANEQCDDGNVTPGDDCDENCLIEPGCGNAWLDDGEECDFGDEAPGGGCDENCQLEELDWPVVTVPATCGDGTAEGDALCPVPPSTCGNGVPEGTEQCDDGNTSSADGCTNVCVFRPLFDLDVTGIGTVTVTQNSAPVCGDDCRVHVAPTGELVLIATAPGAVIPHAQYPGGTCSRSYAGGSWTLECRMPVEAFHLNSIRPLPASPDVPARVVVSFERSPECGDGRVTVFEECDDGNLLDGDGCNSVCQDVPCAPASAHPSKRSNDAGIGCAVQPVGRARDALPLALLLVATGARLARRRRRR